MKSIIKQIKKCSKKKKIYLVGGWIRDSFIKKTNRDLDFATEGNAKLIASNFAKLTHGSFVTLDESNKTYRVVLKDNKKIDYVDFSKFKGSDIYEDLSNRDFTINSFAIDLDNDIDKFIVIDKNNGLNDLKNKSIRMISAKAFKDDPLRLLRAFRIAAELNFEIENNTLKHIKINVNLIKKVAHERIKDEFFRILSVDNSYGWIMKMDKVGLLEILLPEIKIMKKSARRFYFHPNGLWQHSMETLKSLEDIFLKMGKYFHDSEKNILIHLEQSLSQKVSRKNLLKMLALLHDVSKPECAKKVGNRMRFLDHEFKGSLKVACILKRFKMSNNEIKISKNIVEHHMRPISLSQANVLTKRATLRFFNDLGDNTIDLLLLALADWHSYKNIKTNKPKNLKKQELVLKELISRYFIEKEKPVRPKIIDGNVLMKKLKLKPGPLIGKLLSKINEAYALGKLKDTDQATSYAKKQLKKSKK
ncbi:HD domain-containing protein [Elusimicrobiota bacterium]